MRPVPATPRRRGRGRRRRDWTAALMLLPAVLLFAGVQLAPMIYSAALSFFRWDGLSAPRFVGWNNFRSFLVDDTLLRHLFYQSLWNNLKLAAFVTLGVVLVSLVLAWAMSRAPRRITGIFRTTLLFPMVTTGIAVFFAWTALLGPGGPVVRLFDSLHLGFLAPYNGWFGDPKLSIVGVIVVAIWSNVPYATLFYLAGMQSIDEQLYEAAELDGANRFQQARMITIPLLNPVTAIVVVLNIVAAMQSYEMVYLMTNGGPNFTTNTIGLLSYNLAFGTIGGTAAQFGTSAAMTWTLVAALAVGFGSFRLLRRTLSRTFA